MGRKAKSKSQSTKGSRKGGHEPGSKAQTANDRTGVDTNVSILRQVLQDEAQLDKYVDYCVESPLHFSLSTDTIRSAISDSVPQPFRKTALEVFDKSVSNLDSDNLLGNLDTNSASDELSIQDFVFSNNEDCMTLAGELTADRLKSVMRRGMHTSSLVVEDLRDAEEYEVDLEIEAASQQQESQNLYQCMKQISSNYRKDLSLKQNPPLGNESCVVNEYAGLSFALHTQYLEHLTNLAELTELTMDIQALERRVASEGARAARIRTCDPVVTKWQTERESYARSRKKAEADRARVRKESVELEERWLSLLKQYLDTIRATCMLPPSHNQLHAAAVESFTRTCASSARKSHRLTDDVFTNCQNMRDQMYVWILSGGEVDELDAEAELKLNGGRAMLVKVPSDIQDFLDAVRDRWHESSQVYQTLLFKKAKHTNAATRSMLLSVLSKMLTVSYPRFVKLQADLAAQELIREEEEMVAQQREVRQAKEARKKQRMQKRLADVAREAQRLQELKHLQEEEQARLEAEKLQGREKVRAEEEHKAATERRRKEEVARRDSEKRRREEQELERALQESRRLESERANKLEKKRLLKLQEEKDLELALQLEAQMLAEARAARAAQKRADEAVDMASFFHGPTPAEAHLCPKKSVAPVSLPSDSAREDHPSSPASSNQHSCTTQTHIPAPEDAVSNLQNTPPAHVNIDNNSDSNDKKNHESDSGNPIGDHVNRNGKYGKKKNKKMKNGVCLDNVATVPLVRKPQVDAEDPLDPTPPDAVVATFKMLASPQPLLPEVAEPETVEVQAEVVAETVEVQAEVGAETLEVQAEVGAETVEVQAEVGAETVEVQAEVGAETVEVQAEVGAETVEVQAEAETREEAVEETGSSTDTNQPTVEVETKHMDETCIPCSNHTDPKAQRDTPSEEPGGIPDEVLPSVSDCVAEGKHTGTRAASSEEQGDAGSCPVSPAQDNNHDLQYQEVVAAEFDRMRALAEHSQVVRAAVDAKWRSLEGVMRELEARGVGPNELTRAETGKQRRAVLEYSLAMAHLRRQEADAAFVARRYQALVAAHSLSIQDEQAALQPFQEQLRLAQDRVVQTQHKLNEFMRLWTDEDKEVDQGMSAHEVIMNTLMELSITDVGTTSPPGPTATCHQDRIPTV